MAYSRSCSFEDPFLFYYPRRFNLACQDKEPGEISPQIDSVWHLLRKFMKVYGATTRSDDLATIILAYLCFDVLGFITLIFICKSCQQLQKQSVQFYFHSAFFKHLATLIETHGNNVDEFYTLACSIVKQTIYINFKRNGNNL